MRAIIQSWPFASTLFRTLSCFCSPGSIAVMRGCLVPWLEAEATNSLYSHNFQSSRKPVNSKYNPTYNYYTKPKSRPNMSISEWPGWEVQCQRDVLIHRTEGLSPPVVSFLAIFGHTTDKSYQLLQQCHMDGNPMEKLCICVEEQQNLRGGTSVFVWRTERIWMKGIFVGSKK